MPRSHATRDEGEEEAAAQRARARSELGGEGAEEDEEGQSGDDDQRGADRIFAHRLGGALGVDLGGLLLLLAELLLK